MSNVVRFVKGFLNHVGLYVSLIKTFKGLRMVFVRGKRLLGYSRSLDFFVRACRENYITKQKNRSDNEETIDSFI